MYQHPSSCAGCISLARTAPFSPVAVPSRHPTSAPGAHLPPRLVMHHRARRQATRGVCPAPPPRKPTSHSASPHTCCGRHSAHRPCWIGSDGGGGRESLSEKQKRRKRKDKHPVDLREVNSRREPRITPFPGEYLSPLFR